MKKVIDLMTKYVPKDELAIIMSKGTDESLGNMLTEQSKLPDAQSILCRQVDREECECVSYCMGTKYNEEDRLLKLHDPDKEGIPMDSGLWVKINKQAIQFAIKNNSLQTNCVRIELQININQYTSKEQPKQKLNNNGTSRRVHIRQMIKSRRIQEEVLSKTSNKTSRRKQSKSQLCTNSDKEQHESLGIRIKEEYMEGIMNMGCELGHETEEPDPE